MKRLYISFLILLPLATVMFTACDKDQSVPSVVVDGPKPKAAFTNSAGALQVAFTNTTTDGETYYWQFGDGSSSTEKSPVHTYAISGKYTVKLKTKSAAGYMDTISKVVPAASAAVADFSVASSFVPYVVFNNNSTAADVVSWDFGDNTTSTEMSPTHKFPALGNYTVKLTVTGLLGDVVTTTKTVSVVDYNLLKGGDMEAGAAAFWTSWSSQNNNPPVFGYTTDKPKAGYDASLRFPSFSNSGGSTNQLIYQAVQVEAGSQYKLSAQIKLPAGGSQEYLQFYISKDANTWVEDGTANANHFLALNSWHGWGGLNNSTAIDGDLAKAVSQNGMYGFGATTGGVYTATFTGTVYIGIQAGTWQGKSNGDVLIDNVSFVKL